MEDKENNSYTYTQKIISQVVSNNDKETIKAITRYCEENNVYPNLISEERLKEVIELGLKSEILQQELSKANDKLNEIEELISTYPSVRIIEEQGIRFAIEVSSSELVDLLKTVLKIIKGEEEK